jgi:hypothetical protein
MRPYRCRSAISWHCLCDVSANTRLDSLHDLARHKASLRIVCRTCDKVRTFDAQRFARYCMLRGWNTQLASLSARLVCQQSGARNGHLSATPDRPGPDPFPKAEADWKQLFRQLRD